MAKNHHLRWRDWEVVADAFVPILRYMIDHPDGPAVALVNEWHHKDLHEIVNRLEEHSRRRVMVGLERLEKKK